MSAAGIARAVRARTISPLEILEDAIVRIESREPAVGAFLLNSYDEAREAARRVDARVQKGEVLPLAGVPLGIKDNLCVDGMRTTCASKILDGWLAPYTATAVQRLLDAGAIPMGKLNMD